MALRDTAGCPAPADSETTELTFDGVAYILNARCLGGDCLEITVEQKSDTSTWSATFAAKYVEEITAKTGSFKRFPVFTKMLFSAIRQESESVYVDLLTYQDLELLRTKRASSVSSGAAAADSSRQQAPNTASSGSNKRYLILTYAAEFDRVHYPLPLLFDEHPNPQRLKATISQLRSQLAAATGGSSRGLRCRPTSSLPASAAAAEVKQLRKENAALRAQLQEKDATLGAVGSSSSSLAADVQQLAADAQETAHGLRNLRRERDSLAQRLQQAEAALEGERNLHRRELRRRGKQLVDVEDELTAAKDQIRELRLKCRELAQELDLTHRRAKVASMSANLRAGQPPVGPRSASAGRIPSSSRSSQPSLSHTPLGSRHPSRDPSPAPARRAPLPGYPRSRSAEVSRPSSQPSSRPDSAGRFDPTQYVRDRREREREAARRLDERRRVARAQSPASCGGSLSGSRLPSLPSSRNSTPQRSRVPSRDPSADRARQAAGMRSVERSQGLQGANPRERSIAVHSTERLRAAAVYTTQLAGRGSFPRREQRSTSPGRALLEVQQRLQHYVTDRSAGGGSPAPDQGGLQQAQQDLRQSVQQPRVPLTGDTYADASAEIADIDSRLQSLQNFLKAAKAGEPAAVPA